MADSTRPRPRPRPVLKAKPLQADQTSIPTPGASSLGANPTNQILVRDDDEMFIRNRKRTNQHWERLEKLNKPKVIELTDSDEEIPSRPRKQKKKETKFSWQTAKDPRLLSVGLSDSSGSDDVEVIGVSTLKASQDARRKRQRSRSKSITPPPALPYHHIQNARNVVRQTLDHAPRAASPDHIDFDDSGETVFTNPELAYIAETIASKPVNHSQPPTRASSVVEHDTITISVKWQPHPLNEAGKEDVWVFKMNRDDNFRDLFEAVAEEASILTESLIVCYNGTRLYSSVTPITLKMWGEAELVACDKITYDYIRKNPVASTQPFDPATPVEVLPDTDAPTPPNGTQESDAESDSDDNTFKLILRSTITKDITLIVRPTTKCGAIVKAFLKKADVAEQYPKVFGGEAANKSKGSRKSTGGKKGQASEKVPALSVDGDKMGNDAEIGEAELEDGDLVDVVGL
ncbi:hypothetical protein BDZ94DRAFT_1245911 [Collybia nuda]|uniref:Rad60/SUMO-like domain-containing protein n=1 Tax=Collybia nuda TaxID=64659 RepID=A0A9P5YG46_9AGAR|nr:hypothetical protein BDZ94DRAFT_1245911 [Collybia nuda]